MPKFKSHPKPSPRQVNRHGGGNDSGASDAPCRTPAQLKRSNYEFIAKWFGFHRLCSNAHCRRANGCKGDTCFDAYWPHVPEREKERFRRTILARGDGASIADSMAVGEAAALRCDELEAKAREWEQVHPASHVSYERRVEPAPQVEPPSKPQWQPRIRVL